MTFMFNLAVNPQHGFERHQDASYKQALNKCESCNNELANYVLIPGHVEEFETKEQMLKRLTSLASDLWDKAKSIT